MALETKHFYEFGEFRFDPSEGDVFRNGQPLRLTPKAIHLLKILVENHGHLVEKDNLISEVWPDSFVEDGNLAVNIAMLRKALGDSAGVPTVIETVPRRGYRFIASVERKNHEANIITGEYSGIGAGQRKRLHKKQYLVAGAFAVLGLSAIGWFASGLIAPSSPSAPILSRPYKAENFAGAGGGHAVITPDGKYVAYTNESGGGESVWLRKLETAENIQIVPPNSYEYLGFAISHDANTLYFVRRRTNEQASSAIYRVGTFGGIPVKITEKTEGWISISSDDQQISYVRCNKLDDDYCSLYIAAVDGRGERSVLVRPRPGRITANSFTPDGKSIVFAEGQSSTGGSDFRLMRVDIESGVVTQILPRTFFNIRCMEWLPDNENLLVVAMEELDGVGRIWQISSVTGEARLLTNDATNYATISLDKAAENLIATHISNNFQLYVAPVNDVVKTSIVTAARSITFASKGRIVYSANDGNLWSINSDGGDQHQLTNNSFANFRPKASSDGKYIFFASNRSGENHVWRMNVDGSDQIQITSGESGNLGSVAADGNTAYFISGRLQTLWSVSVGGKENQVLSQPVVGPAVSPDGKLVAYFYRGDGDQGFRIAVVSIADGNILKTFNPADDVSYQLRPLVAWEPNKMSFLYIISDGSQNLLWSQSVDDGPPSLLGNLGGDEIADIALSPDGTALAFTRGKWIQKAVLIRGLK